MRCGLAAALLLLPLLGTSPAFAQAFTPLRPGVGAAPEAGRAIAPARPGDPALETELNRSEARLKRREDQAKRTLRGICRGC